MGCCMECIVSMRNVGLVILWEKSKNGIVQSLLVQGSWSGDLNDRFRLGVEFAQVLTNVADFSRKRPSSSFASDLFLKCGFYIL